MLHSAQHDFFARPAIAKLLQVPASPQQPILWTDDYSSILPILH